MTERKLGRVRSSHDGRDIMLVKFLAAVQAPPTSIDYSAAVKTWPMLDNDKVGCCTISAQGHQIESWTANAQGKEAKITNAEVLTRYEQVSGYVPGDESTDVGANERDVLKLWQKEPLAGHSLTAFGQVTIPRGNLMDRQHFMQALWVLGGLYLGLDLPLTAQQQIEDGKPWDVESGSKDAKPGSWGGHAVPAVAYSEAGVTVVTWGALQLMTWAFVSAYVSENWGLVSTDWLKSGKSPGGFDLPTLEADLAALKAA